MITKEVRIWLEKVQRNQYSYEDAMYEFMIFAKYLTKDEINMLKKHIQESYKT